MMTLPSMGLPLRSAVEMQAWRDSYAIAENAAEAIKRALKEIGVRQRFYHSPRPAVAPSGLPLVYVGYLPADVAEQIAEALRHQGPGPLAQADPDSADRQDG